MLMQRYKEDVQSLLAEMTPANFAQVVKAIELTSHYAALALGETKLDANSPDDTGDYGAAKALMPVHEVPIQTASPASEPAVSEPTSETTVAPALPPDEFRVERKLIGALAGNHFFTESAVRQLDLADGDTVRIRDDYDDEEAVTIIARNQSTAPSRIITVTGAVVKQDDTLPAGYRFRADRDIRGDVLLKTKDGLPVTFLIKPTDVARLALRQDDIVDLSWYRTDGPQVATVTWVYKDAKGLKPKAQHVAKPKKKAAQAAAKATGDEPVVTAKTYTPQLDFDLADKHVLLVGNVASASALTAVVAAHNGGETTATDAQKGTQLKHKLGRADVAVLITDEVHHITTNTAVKIAKKLHVPYAVANGDSPLLVERALYRALNGMPAYEPAQSEFEYPELTGETTD